MLIVRCGLKFHAGGARVDLSEAKHRSSPGEETLGLMQLAEPFFPEGEPRVASKLRPVQPSAAKELELLMPTRRELHDAWRDDLVAAIMVHPETLGRKP